ncbi:reverse transcriptase domain-containing protein [Tanacetum coccineum]
MKHSYSNDDTCFSIDVIDEILEEDFDALLDEEPPKDLELKPLLDNLEYVFLEEPSFLPVIISSQLSKEKKNKLIFIADSPWVSPIHCVPKKGGIIVVTNENDELVPTRTVTGWRIPIDPNDQEKTTFTCPFGTYPYRRMLFGLCHIPKVYVGNLSRYDRRIRRNLTLSIIENSLHGPKKGIGLRTQCVLAPDLKLTKQKSTPLNKLLEKDTPFEFDDECQKAFESLKEKLTCALVIVSSNWNLLFELMCDASDFAGGAVLVAVNYVSKWAEAQALPTNDARVVVTFLKKLICHFRMPKALISDRGTHFCNKIMEKTMKRYGVNHRFSTSYHPQTSGQVENTNRALKIILETTVKDNPAIWSRKLNDALWAFRTAYKTPTGTTSYKLIYGKNCHLPFEIEHRAYWALKKYNPYLIAAGEKRMFQLHELDELRYQAYENSCLYKERTKDSHDKKL